MSIQGYILTGKVSGDHHNPSVEVQETGDVLVGRRVMEEEEEEEGSANGKLFD